MSPTASFGAFSFRLARRPQVLAEVRREGVDVAVWRRPVPARLRGVLEEWAATTEAEPFDGFVTEERMRVGEAVAALSSDVRGAVADDVSGLLAAFFAVVNPGRARLFVGVVRDDRCKKFHVDAVALRMVTTYVGPGTEWLPEHAVDREALARGIACPSEANAAIVARPEAVRHARCGDVLMLKGSRHPTARGRGAVHRSPPLHHAGPRRFVLIATAGGPW